MTYKRFGIGILAIIAMASALSLRSSLLLPEQATGEAAAAAYVPTSSSSSIATSSPKAPTATMSIEGTKLLVEVREHTTVLDAMNALAANGSLRFTGRQYPSLGYFVETINDKKASDGSNWFLYMNDRSSETGASQTVIKPGDVVEWRYEQNH